MRALPSVIEPRGSIALSGLQRHLGFVRPGVAPPASSGALGPFGPLGRSLSAPPRPDRRKGSALHALGGFLFPSHPPFSILYIENALVVIRSLFQ